MLRTSKLHFLSLLDVLCIHFFIDWIKMHEHLHELEKHRLKANKTKLATNLLELSDVSSGTNLPPLVEIDLEDNSQTEVNEIFFSYDSSL